MNEILSFEIPIFEILYFPLILLCMYHNCIIIPRLPNAIYTKHETNIKMCFKRTVKKTISSQDDNTVYSKM